MTEILATNIPSYPGSIHAEFSVPVSRWCAPSGTPGIQSAMRRKSGWGLFHFVLE